MAIRPLRWALPLVLVLAIGAEAATAATRAGSGTVNAAMNSSYGNLLVSSTGLSLYGMTSEKKGAIGCAGTCAKFWPPLLVGADVRPRAGAGIVQARLGTIKRPDGGVQVTYNGMALYRYKLDKKAGDVRGEGVEGIWFAVTAAGKLAKTSPASGTAPAGTTTPPTSTAPTSTAPDPGYSPGY